MDGEAQKQGESVSSRPAFAKDFPRHPELDRILEIFEQGNYALVRKEAQALLLKIKNDKSKADKKATDKSAPKEGKRPYRAAVKLEADTVKPASEAEVGAEPEVDIRPALREVLRRLEPDPLALGLVGVAAILLVILAGWYWTHPHEGPPPRPAPAPGPISS